MSQHLFAPIDVASLVIFRVAFGAIMLWETWRYFDQDRIERYYLEPTVLFKYFGFAWVEPWAGDGMFWHFALLGLLALMVMVGLCYRVSASLLFVLFTYVFLLDQSRYLNHFYLLSLISFLMIFLSAHRALSLDSVIWPKQRSDAVPAWTVGLMRAQLGIVYAYAGIAKLNADWMQGRPARLMLETNADRTLLGDTFAIGEILVEPWFVHGYAWGGLLFDLLIVPALVWPRTRAYAFVACIGFHLANAWMFDIGVFPWFMLAATTIFLAPNWPRDAKLLFARFCPDQRPYLRPFGLTDRRRRLTLGLLGVYLAVQLVIPLRHLLIPGSVHWTEEGHRWSWHMKLRVKHGGGVFLVRDASGGRDEIVDPHDYLEDRQLRKMICTPDMILQFAHILAEDWRAAGHEQVEVRALIRCSLNGRPAQLIVDPEVDLAAESRTLGHADWIVPLEP